MSDDLLALLLTLLVFLLMALWVPFLAYLQFIDYRDRDRPKKLAQVRHDNLGVSPASRGMEEKPLSARELYSEEFSPADARANDSHFRSLTAWFRPTRRSGVQSDH